MDTEVPCLGPGSSDRWVGVGASAVTELTPLLEPAESPFRSKERTLGVVFLWVGSATVTFILFYFYQIGHSPPLALNGSGFENSLQNYTTTSCSPFPGACPRRGGGSSDPALLGCPRGPLHLATPLGPKRAFQWGP